VSDRVVQCGTERETDVQLRVRKTLTRVYTYIGRTRTLRIQLEIRSMYIYIYIIYDCTVFIFPLDPVSVESTTLLPDIFFFFPETQMLVRFTQTRTCTGVRYHIRYTPYNNIYYAMCTTIYIYLPSPRPHPPLPSSHASPHHYRHHRRPFTRRRSGFELLFSVLR